MFRLHLPPQAFRSSLGVVLLIVGYGSHLRAEPEPRPPLDYARDILPILSDNCYHCHGPDAQSRQADLRLDTEAGALGADGGAVAIVPGKSDESELIRRIFSEEEWEVMPPPDSNRSLTMEQKERLRQWVEEGATWGEQWSLRPLRRPDLPPLGRRHDPRSNSPIDRFIEEARVAQGFLIPEENEGENGGENGGKEAAARGDEERADGDEVESHRGWSSPEAIRERLIRRVTLDLTGLPPTLAEVQDFVDDDSPDAYQRLVDRLLASPRYGERMASEWLDLARFADTHGYQMDRNRPVWPYRDWVIKAFNENLPYDEFVTWQLAGDLLPNATKEQQLATAFQRLHMQNEEGGIVEEEFRVAHVVDRVNTFGTAFLGMTFECARCHDHKYDPITQEDYYSLFSFFQNIDESGQTSYFTASMPVPTMLLSTDQQDRKLLELEEGMKALERRIEDQRGSARREYPHWRDEVLSTSHVTLTRPVAAFPLDEISDGSTPNSIREDQPGRAHDGPELVKESGRVGPAEGRGAVRLSGENGFTFPGVGHFSRADPFSLSLSLQTPDHASRYVVLHHSRAPIDAGSRGYELLLEEGKVAVGLHHMWPGNSLKVRTVSKLEPGEWSHVAVSYDGSSRASGVQIYLNGESQDLEIIRDGLWKDITYEGSEPDLAVGYRFRDNGFRGGLVADLVLFDSALTPLEARLLFASGGSGKAFPLVDASAGDPDSDSAGPASDSPATADARVTAKWWKNEFSEMPDEVLWEHFWQREYQEVAADRKELAKLRKEQSAFIQPIPEIMVMRELDQPKPAHILLRGEYDQLGDPVSARPPEVLPPLPQEAPRNRLGLAHWLLDPEHPLMARVTANRIWQLLMGRGIVDTPDNFGFQGSSPSHPELLDWLAVELIDGGWDQKRLVREIVMSATYRQASSFPRQVVDRETGSVMTREELTRRDPENRWFTRASARRLTAEMLRDQALAVSGLLVGTMGGPSVKPYQPEGLWDIAMGKPRYETSSGGDRYRRSLYTYWKRTVPPPSMVTFDAADRNNCAVERQVTSTPLQALVLLNDPQFTEAARQYGQRMLREGGDTDGDRVEWLFRSITSRRPSDEEKQVLLQLFQEQRELFLTDVEESKKVVGSSEATELSPADLAELAAAGILASAMLNHDESVMRR